MILPNIRPAEEWLKLMPYNLKGVQESTIREIQFDAFRGGLTFAISELRQHRQSNAEAMAHHLESLRDFSI